MTRNVFVRPGMAAMCVALLVLSAGSARAADSMQQALQKGAQAAVEPADGAAKPAVEPAVKPAAETTPAAGPAAAPATAPEAEKSAPAATGAGPTESPAPAQQDPKTDLGAVLASAPDWVVGGCPAFVKFTGIHVLCGEGAVEGIKDPGMCMTAAVNRGQAAMMRDIVSMLTEAMTKAGCDDNGGVVDKTTTTVEKDGATATKRVVRAKISGTRVSARWAGPDGRCSAIVTMDLGAFQSSVFANCAAQESARKKIYQAADEVWDALMKQMNN